MENDALQQIRRREIEEGMALSALGGGPGPSPEAIKIYEEYIACKISFDEMKINLLKIFS